MIMLCERCFAAVDADDDNVLRLAHIDRVLPDGDMTWNYSYTHTGTCQEPRLPGHQRPDTGSWDPSRGIRSLRR